MAQAQRPVRNVVWVSDDEDGKEEEEDIFQSDEHIQSENTPVEQAQCSRPPPRAAAAALHTPVQQVETEKPNEQPSNDHTQLSITDAA